MDSSITNMIIQIDKSIRTYVLEKVERNFLSFLDDLCSSRKLGHILIHSSKKTLLTIIEKVLMSPLQNQIIKQSNEEMTFNNSLFEFIKYRMIVMHSDYDFEKNNYDENFIFIDLKNYNREYTEKGINPFRAPKLVLEDINDSEIYKKICEWYRSSNNLIVNKKISLEFHHGGGDRTSLVCKDLIESGHNVFCICDSDAKYFGDRTSYGTSKKLMELFDFVKKPKNLHVLDCQEVENLIPPSILSATAKKTQLPAINFINHITKISPSSYLYMDLKNGFKYDLIFPERPNDYSSYWNPLFENFNCDTYESIILEIKNKKIPSNSSIICKLSSLIPHAIENLKNQESIELVSSLQDEWEKIAISIFSWGCSEHPLRL